MDKSHTALVGYREGGAAALLFGARWASDFSSICAVEATEVPAASLAAVGGQYVLPFPGDTTRGVQEEAIEARTVDTPVWFLRSAAETTNRAALEYYLQANQASAKAGGVYPCGRTGSASEVRVTEKRSARTPSGASSLASTSVLWPCSFPAVWPRPRILPAGAMTSMRSGSTESFAAGWSMFPPATRAVRKFRWCW
ncbi:MAG: hypothetical protein ACLVBX_01990 [Faecalibacterium prausnitzii]